MQHIKNATVRTAIWIGAFAVCASSVGCRSHTAAETDDAETDAVLAEINGQALTQRDFERSQAWLPPFARQLDADRTLDNSRFWNLIYLVRIAQDAEEKSLLSDAERNLAIKEALAAHNIQSTVDPNFVVTDEAIDAYLAQHGAELTEPAAYTVNYASVKNAERVKLLYMGWHFARGAQLGYNFSKSEPVPRTRVAGVGQTTNERGRPIDGNLFNFVYARTMQEDSESPSQIGPFSSSDEVLFSCPETMAALEKAEIGAPIARDLACSGQWKAFVIPAWKRAAAKMDGEKARQVAAENIRSAHNEAYRARQIGE